MTELTHLGNPDTRPEQVRHYKYDSPNHGKRGPDKKPRSPRGKKTLQARYFEATGRKIEDDMKAQREKVDMLYECAKMFNDPDERMAALEKAHNAEDKFNKTWLPYFQSKMGTIQTQVEEEDLVSLDDILSGSNGTT